MAKIRKANDLPFWQEKQDWIHKQAFHVKSRSWVRLDTAAKGKHTGKWHYADRMFDSYGEVIFFAMFESCSILRNHQTFYTGDLAYTPDFFVNYEGVMYAIEIKGHPKQRGIAESRLRIRACQALDHVYLVYLSDLLKNENADRQAN